MFFINASINRGILIQNIAITLVGFVLLISVLFCILHKKQQIRPIFTVVIAAVIFFLNLSALFYNSFILGDTHIAYYLQDLLSAISYSMQMLAFKSNLSALGVLAESPWFVLLYNLVLLVAYFIYFYILLSFVSIKILSKIKLTFAGKKKAYVFMQLNANSIRLCQEVREKEKRALIVFALSGFDKNTLKDERVKQALQLPTCVYVSGKRGSLFQRFPLLKRHDVQVFCVDEEEDKNITLLEDIYEENAQFFILLKGFGQQMEMLTKSNVRAVRLQDKIAAQLVQESMPYSCIDWENHSLNVLFFGFGNMGQEVMKKVYITSHFQGIRKQFYLIEKQDRLGLFRSQFPAIDDITFLQAEAEGRTFFEQLQTCVGRNNYITVCLGKDEVNLRIAQYLMEALEKLDVKAVINVNIDDANKRALLPPDRENIRIHAFGCAQGNLPLAAYLNDAAWIFAKNLHEKYRSIAGGKPFEELSFLQKNLSFSVMYCLNSKLAALGLKVVDADAQGEAVRLQSLSQEVQDQAAFEEHERWMAFYKTEGYEQLTIEESKKLSQDGNIVSRLTHPKKHICMVDFDELDVVDAYLGQNTKSYDYFWLEALDATFDAMHLKAVKRA